jgi:hypothetical protein
VRERDRIQLATVVNRLNGVVKARTEFVARDRSRDTGAAVAGQPRRLDVDVVCIGLRLAFVLARLDLPEAGQDRDRLAQGRRQRSRGLLRPDHRRGVDTVIAVGPQLFRGVRGLLIAQSAEGGPTPRSCARTRSRATGERPDPAWKNAPAKYAVVIVVTWLMVGISLAYGVFDAVKAALQLLG